MRDGMEIIHNKIRSFQKKYYLNIFIKGVILTATIVVGYFLVVAVLEHTLWFNPSLRTIIFFSFFLVVGYCVLIFLKQPIIWWLAGRGMNEDQSAKIIGSSLPTVKDRLLNLLQLGRQSSSSLAIASIKQKSTALEPVQFESVIVLEKNWRFIKFLAAPVALILLILLIDQKIITDSTNRIIHFNQKFSPQAPFAFQVENEEMVAFYNEDFTLKVRLNGNAIPQDVYLDDGTQRIKLIQQGASFAYTFENIQTPLSFQLEAAGFYSPRYNVRLLNRPELTGFEIALDYPRYLQKKNEVLKNAGNLEIPEGTVVNWRLLTAHAENAKISFLSEQAVNDFQFVDNQHFSLSKRIVNPDHYEIQLNNNVAKNRDRISYKIDVIKDQNPGISVNNLNDTVFFKRVMIGGFASDDYGLTQLDLHYRVLDQNQNESYKGSRRIPITKGQQQQSFIYNWSLDSIELTPGQQLEYYLQVWDNDGVNGRKFTRSSSYKFMVPSEDKIIADIDNTSRETQSAIDRSSTKASDLQEKIERASQNIKSKQNLDWQDKKALEEILKQKEELDKLVNELKDQNKMLLEKRETFLEQDERIREKAEQIQKLMDELLDEETKKLFEELQKLLKENTDISQLQKLLDKLNKNTNNLEKELDRMLELFKQIQFETKFDQTLKDLENQIKEQKELLEKTDGLESTQKEKESNKKDSRRDDSEAENQENQKLAKEQEEIKEEFENTSKELEELKKLGEEIDQAEEVPEKEDADEILNEQQQSQEMLEQNQPSKSKQNQQKALDQMQKMQQEMQDAQSSMSMEMDMQNIESLRQILHGLIKLSFDEEKLMKEFSQLQSSDPRFNNLAEEQLRIQDNAKVLEDSLLALSKRDPFMGSFVNKEINELNDHLNKATEANRERRKPQAQSEMQSAMTSINNLALMLDSHFDMMMQMMANAKPGMKKSKQKGNQPSLSQLQQQLNEKIQELKNSGKSGRELSEELAEMAAEQERIRRAIQEMQEKIKEQNGTIPGGELPSKMEQTEMDLVNKQLTDQLIKRQREILTRLLETEKSLREQDMDEERKGETAKDYEKEIPKAFEDYLRLKEKELELLKTVPSKLYPYYKREVDDYFKRMNNQ
jgi:hypothetical protein